MQAAGHPKRQRKEWKAFGSTRENTLAQEQQEPDQDWQRPDKSCLLQPPGEVNERLAAYPDHINVRGTAGGKG